MDNKNLFTRWKSLSQPKKILTVAVPVVVIAAVIVVIILMNSGIRSTSMRLLRMEGIVKLEDANGVEKSLIDNMRFASGDAISTGAASLASIALDDHKIVTLDENSRAQFIQDGNMMELNLTDGGVFFEVNKPLEEDETFDIVTSTMTVGIRGTSGYVHVDEQGIASLILTSGHVHITGKNPETGETKSLDVEPGQRVQIYLFNDRTVDTVDFYLEQITEEQLNQFIINYLCENDAARITVCNATGWSEEIILELGSYSITVTDETEETEETEETPTPTPTEAPSGTPAATPTETPTPTPRPNGNAPSPTLTPTPTPAATNSPTPTLTPTPTPTPAPVPPTITPAPTPTQAPSPDPTEPSGATDPTDPTGATNPTGATDPTDPTDPTDTEEEIPDPPSGYEIWSGSSDYPVAIGGTFEEPTYVGLIDGDWVDLGYEEIDYYDDDGYHYRAHELYYPNSGDVFAVIDRECVPPDTYVPVPEG